MRSKPDNVLQAQMEVFADTQRDIQERAVLLNNSEALSAVEDLESPQQGEEVDQLVAEYKARYKSALKQKEFRERVRKRVEYERIYHEKFAAPVAELRAKMDQAKDVTQMEEYLGAGSGARAFKIQVEGEWYAVKMLKDAEVHLFFEELMMAEGIDNVAQVRAASNADNALVMNLLPGQELSQYKEGEIPKFAPSHLEKLVDTVMQLNQAGITVDPKISNFMYDTESGFQILDFYKEKKKNGVSRESQILFVAEIALGVVGSLPEYDFRDEQATAAHYDAYYKVVLPRFIAFFSAVKNNYPDMAQSIEAEFLRRQNSPRESASPVVDLSQVPSGDPFDLYLRQLRALGMNAVIEPTPDESPQDPLAGVSGIDAMDRDQLTADLARYNAAQKQIRTSQIERRERQDQPVLPNGVATYTLPYSTESIQELSTWGLRGEAFGGLGEFPHGVELDVHSGTHTITDHIQAAYSPTEDTEAPQIQVLFDLGDKNVVDYMKTNQRPRVSAQEDSSGTKVHVSVGVPANYIAGVIIPPAIYQDEDALYKIRFSLGTHVPLWKTTGERLRL